MAKIIKFSGYLVDPDNEYDENDIELILEHNLNSMYTQHLHEEPMDIYDMNENNFYDHPLNFTDCDLADCERYFKKEPTVKSDREPKIGEVYKHFKTGRKVKVLAISQDTENVGSFSIVYENLEDSSIWHRPYNMFCSEVDKEKYPNATQEYRFELIKEN